MLSEPQVDRSSHGVVGWAVVEERSEPDFQAMVERSPQARHYFSDAFGVYVQLIDGPGQSHVCTDKHETYSVEADNA